MEYIIIILGLLVGSFLNCLAYRLPRQEKILWARSHCPKCLKVLNWLELIPVVSFILQKARCHTCQQKISWQYPVAEILTSLSFLLAFWHSPNIYYLIFNIFIVSILILIFLIDLNNGIILDSIIWSSVIIIFICQWLFGLPLFSFLLAAAIGGGFFGLQYLISRGRWIGSGDIGLGVLMGVILGWPKILFALILAYISGAIIGLVLMTLKKKNWQSALPFGVFLTPATFVTMLWGQAVVDWYLRLIGIQV